MATNETPESASPASEPAEEPLTIEDLVEQQKAKESQETQERFETPGAESQSSPDQPENEQALPEQEPAREQVAKESGAHEEETAAPAAPPAALGDDVQDEDVFLRGFLQQDHPEQVKSLVVLAFKKGIQHAFDIAEQAKDPYLMDAFHDTIVDEVYTELVSRKKMRGDSQAS